MGWELSNLGRYQEALGYCQRAVTLLQQLGGKHHGAGALGQPRLHLVPPRPSCRGRQLYRRAVELNDQLGERYAQAKTLMYAGDAHQGGGDPQLPRARGPGPWPSLRSCTIPMPARSCPDSTA